MKRSIGIAAIGLLAACGSPHVVKTALHGDLPALKSEIARSQSAGALHRRQVERLARAVAGREVRSAQGSAGVRSIRQIEPCAEALIPVLEARAHQADEVGAEATRQLFLRGRRRASKLVRRYSGAESGPWRAVAARAALAPEHGELRRRLMADPDEGVRRSALEASIQARDADDLGPLLETSRLDPDPQNRSLAIRALGSLGGEQVVRALADRWDRADQPGRRAILEAWAEIASFRTGGEAELVRVLEREPGMLALVAASLLIARDGAPHAGALARLTGAIEDGTTEERRFAIAAAPLADGDVRKALDRIRKDRDAPVRVLALARLLDTGDPEARTELRKLAGADDEVAIEARAALAGARDDTVRPALEKQLLAPGSRRRRLAGEGLLRLQAWSVLATALGDDDPVVRTAVACRLLEARIEPTASP